jgi:hypothetical protein
VLGFRPIRQAYRLAEVGDADSLHGDEPMTIARREKIDPSVTRWYHYMSRCVRQALLLTSGAFNRKEWLEDRVEELAEIFAVGVGGFEGKAAISTELSGILERLGSGAESWQLRMEKLSCDSLRLLDL